MKGIFFLLFPMLLGVIGCGKPAEKSTAALSNPLAGEWNYTEYFFSIGGPGEWHPVQGEQVVEFGANGHFRAAESFLSGVTHYEILDSTRVKFSPVSNAAGYVLMNYTVEVKNGVLTLVPIDPACIEGCSYKFVRRSS